MRAFWFVLCAMAAIGFCAASPKDSKEEFRGVLHRAGEAYRLFDEKRGDSGLSGTEFRVLESYPVPREKLAELTGREVVISGYVGADRKPSGLVALYVLPLEIARAK